MEVSQKNTSAYNSVKREYTELLNKKQRPAKKKNLEKVWQILNEIYKGASGSRIIDPKRYSYTEIARLGKNISGPARSTITNESGEDFRTLIDSFVKAVCPVDSDGNSLAGSSIESYLPYLDEITNLQAKSRIASILIEYRSLKRQLDISKNKIATESNPIHTVVGSQVPQIESKPVLNMLEVDSISEFINTIGLKGFEIQGNGSIVDSASGLEIAPAGFVDALRKIID